MNNRSSIIKKDIKDLTFRTTHLSPTCIEMFYTTFKDDTEGIAEDSYFSLHHIKIGQSLAGCLSQAYEFHSVFPLCLYSCNVFTIMDFKGFKITFFITYVYIYTCI